jgi:hypothetical protein
MTDNNLKNLIVEKPFGRTMKSAAGGENLARRTKKETYLYKNPDSDLNIDDIHYSLFSVPTEN